MDLMQTFFDYFLHIDAHLVSFVSDYGMWVYFLLFAVIFCETALIVMPFLPGDSLLFAAGSLAANMHSSIKIQLLFILLLLASILGNKVNYLIGRAIGPKVFSKTNSLFFNKKYLNEAHEFYAKHGGKTIIFARFIPVIRTFAPFVAGASAMGVREFTFFNVFSAVLWIGSLLAAGYFFGSLPFVREHFSMVVYGIIIVSFLPILYTFTRRKLFTSHS